MVRSKCTNLSMLGGKGGGEALHGVVTVKKKSILYGIKFHLH